MKFPSSRSYSLYQKRNYSLTPIERNFLILAEPEFWQNMTNNFCILVNISEILKLKTKTLKRFLCSKHQVIIGTENSPFCLLFRHTYEYFTIPWAGGGEIHTFAFWGKYFWRFFMFSCSIGFSDPKNAIKLVFPLFIRWSGGHKRVLSKRKMRKNIGSSGKKYWVGMNFIQGCVFVLFPISDLTNSKIGKSSDFLKSYEFC